jgi:hypothetical protein
MGWTCVQEYKGKILPWGPATAVDMCARGGVKYYHGVPLRRWTCVQEHTKGKNNKLKTSISRITLKSHNSKNTI